MQEPLRRLLRKCGVPMKRIPRLETEIRRKLFHSYGLVIPVGYAVGATHFGLTAETASAILAVLLVLVLVWECLRLYAPIFLSTSSSSSSSLQDPQFASRDSAESHARALHNAPATAFSQTTQQTTPPPPAPKDEFLSVVSSAFAPLSPPQLQTQAHGHAASAVGTHPMASASPPGASHTASHIKRSALAWLLLVTQQGNHLLRPAEQQRLTGTPFYLAGAAVVLACFADRLAVAAVLFLVLGDAAAACVGIAHGRIRLGAKSLEGSLACFAVCFLVAVVVLWGAPFCDLLAFFGALAATLTELAADHCILVLRKPRSDSSLHLQQAQPHLPSHPLSHSKTHSFAEPSSDDPKATHFQTPHGTLGQQATQRHSHQTASLPGDFESQPTISQGFHPNTSLTHTHLRNGQNSAVHNSNVYHHSISITSNLRDNDLSQDSQICDASELEIYKDHYRAQKWYHKFLDAGLTLRLDDNFAIPVVSAAVMHFFSWRFQIDQSHLCLSPK